MTSLVSSVLSTAVPTPTFKPALPPPPGIHSNPEHPENLKRASAIAVSICCALTTVFFAARCYCRFWVKNTFIFEDVLAIIAWIGTVVNCALVAVTMRRHGGQHVWDITKAQFSEAAFWFNVVSIEYGIAICTTKIAVLMLYRRVFFAHLWSWFDICTITLIVILSLFYGITTFFKIFECAPRAKIFDTSIPGHCYDIGKILKTSGAFNTASDFLILLLPIHAVQKLQMSRQKKILVVLVFTFGLCAPVFATIGLVVRLQRSSNRDTSWGQPTIILWGLAELTSGNLCISFPEMNSLFRARTRHRSHRSHSTPRRPTASELAPYKDPSFISRLSYKRKKKLRAHDPYMMTSLTGTTGTTTLNDGGPYTELDDIKYGVRIESGEKVERVAEPKDGTVMMNREFSVRSHDYNEGRGL